MIHQLRIYEIFENNKSAFHRRFEQHAWRIMKNYGFEILGFWESPGDQGPRFVYLLQWPDEAAMKAAWDGFMADQEWRDIKASTGDEHGPLVGSIEDHLLQPTGYSPGRIG